MIRNLSIKKKIVIWFSLSMLLIVGLMLALIYAISQSVFATDIQTQLQNQVNANADEIEYLNSHELDGEYEAGDQFLEYRSGYLEIDDDFCDYINGIYTCLVDADNNLLYGESPARLTSDQVFQYFQVDQIKYNGEKYFIYERPLQGAHLDGLWVRGMASRREGTHLLSSIVHTAAWFLPLLALISILIGYFIMRRSLSPAEKIIATAESISSGNDLSQRIVLPAGRDEFHVLADSYNQMLNRLESSFQREKQFTSDVSHELRTPVAVVLSQCEFSLEMGGSTEEYREGLEVIQEQALKMTDLISQLLFFSRLEQGREPLQLQSCDLCQLVESVCQEQAKLAKQSGDFRSTVVSEQNLPSPHIFASVDARLFSRVITNLLSNAYKYNRPGGYIKVSLYETFGDVEPAVAGRSFGSCESGGGSGGSIVLKISDSGMGIPEESLPRIFDRFYQVDASRTSSTLSSGSNTSVGGESIGAMETGETGAGLGLAMVREIVHLHGGQITAQSTLNKGSVFTIVFPKE